MNDKSIQCPVCGTKGNVEGGIVYTNFVLTDKYSISCEHCGCSTKHYDTKEDAKAAWERMCSKEKHYKTNNKLIDQLKERLVYAENVINCYSKPHFLFSKEGTKLVYECWRENEIRPSGTLAKTYLYKKEINEDEEKNKKRN